MLAGNEKELKAIQKERMKSMEKSVLNRLLVALLLFLITVLCSGCGTGLFEEIKEQLSQEKELEEKTEEEIEEIVESEIEKYMALRQDMDAYINQPNELLMALNSIGDLNDAQAQQELDQLRKEIEKVVVVQEKISDINTSAITLEDWDNIVSIEENIKNIDEEVTGFVDVEKYEIALRTINHLENDTPAGQVINAIIGLGEISLESKTELDEIVALYENLPESDKDDVTNYSVLESAVRKYDSLVAAQLREEQRQKEAEERARKEAEEAERKAQEEAEKQAQKEREEAERLEAWYNATVFLSRTGSSYHLSGCHHLHGYLDQPIKRREAIDGGYSSCGTCHSGGP